jgi:type IV pilus biogenesis protein CpaD/CtpE
MNTRGFALVLLASLLLTLVGCASTDPDNQSARPWNAPKNWETGLPSSVLEGR